MCSTQAAGIVQDTFTGEDVEGEGGEEEFDWRGSLCSPDNIHARIHRSLSITYFYMNYLT